MIGSIIEWNTSPNVQNGENVSGKTQIL